MGCAPETLSPYGLRRWNVGNHRIVWFRPSIFAIVRYGPSGASVYLIVLTIPTSGSAQECLKPHLTRRCTRRQTAARFGSLRASRSGAVELKRYTP